MSSMQFHDNMLQFSPDKLFQQYGTMVYRLVFLRTKNRFDADDILQKVFLHALRRAPAFRDEAHCRAWLIRSAMHYSKFFTTWARKSVPLSDTLRNELREKSEVYYAVLALPLHYRTVIHLLYYENYTPAEIAEILSLKESTVRLRLFRAQAILRKTLKEEYVIV